MGEVSSVDNVATGISLSQKMGRVGSVVCKHIYLQVLDVTCLCVVTLGFLKVCEASPSRSRVVHGVLFSGLGYRCHRPDTVLIKADRDDRYSGAQTSDYEAWHSCIPRGIPRSIPRGLWSCPSCPYPMH